MDREPGWATTSFWCQWGKLRRTDRLFEIMQIFRSGNLCRGREIAERLEVSLRTIYRDIDTLVASGVPIEGERGVGYILREPIFLPPLTLTVAELEALHLGMEIVRQTAGHQMAEAAHNLLIKVDAVLPSDRQGRNHLADLSIYASAADKTLPHLAGLRSAITGRQVVEIDYMSLSDASTRRRIRPLQCEYWGDVWTCTAWCELRTGFRVFRVDCISKCAMTGETFQIEPGRSYEDYLSTL